MAENNEKMALLSAEGGGIFSIMAGRYAFDGKANLEIFLKGFSGDYCAVDRIGREAKILNEPALTIGLFVQPHVVRRSGKFPGAWINGQVFIFLPLLIGWSS